MSSIVGGLGPEVLALQGLTRLDLVVRMLVAFGLTFAIGFERELRGASAGDRTFALVGLGSAVIGYLALNHAPNALAGVVTGVGFLGAGVIIHGGAQRDVPVPADDDGQESMVRGVTTAATIYLAAAVGAAAGQGELLLATMAAVAAIFLLELRHSTMLRWLDGRRWARRLNHDDDLRHFDKPRDET